MRENDDVESGVQETGGVDKKGGIKQDKGKGEGRGAAGHDHTHVH